MRAPAFQFYAADYLADEHVQLMTLEEEGIYIRLLAYCWREGSIPADPELLSRLAKGGSTKAVAMVRERFEPHPNQPDRLIHPRLEFEREKHERWREKSAEGGRKSGETRAKAAKKPIRERAKKPPAVVEPPLNHPSKGGSTLHTSSSTSSSEEKKDSRRGADAPPKAPNVIWDLGVTMLTNAGWTEDNARSFLGKQAKEYGQRLVAQAVTETSVANVANPHEYLAKLLKTHEGNINGKPNGAQSYGGKPGITRDFSKYRSGSS